MQLNHVAFMRSLMVQPAYPVYLLTAAGRQWVINYPRFVFQVASIPEFTNTFEGQSDGGYLVRQEGRLVRAPGLPDAGEWEAKKLADWSAECGSWPELFVSGWTFYIGAIEYAVMTDYSDSFVSVMPMADLRRLYSRLQFFPEKTLVLRQLAAETVAAVYVFDRGAETLIGFIMTVEGELDTSLVPHVPNELYAIGAIPPEVPETAD